MTISVASYWASAMTISAPAMISRIRGSSGPAVS